MFIRQSVETIAVSLTLCFAATILSNATAHCAEQQAELATSELTCEYATNPLGVDTPQPRFGWLLKSDRRSQLQSAYRVLVATSEKQLQAGVGDKWDSGKIASADSVNVEYRGKPLASDEVCYWKVQVWDKQGRPSTWSKPASYEMGLMEQSDWKGQWIGVKPPSPPADHLDDEKPGRRNVALFAKPTTSFVSGHETLDAINDGFKPAKSDDKRYGTYGNWPQKGAQWVQYEWPKSVHVDSIDVYWFDDRGGVRLPKTARLLYWDGKAFVPVKNPVGLGVEGNKYNTTTFDEVTTSKLKLEFDSIKTASTGILEFKVYDAGKSPKFPPTNKVNRFVALANAAVAPSPLLRKEFAVTKKVRQARVHISGLGWSELYINGKKVSDDVLSPNLTDYSQEVLYRTYDVTSFLKSGANAVGMMLGNGWYSATSVQPWVKGGPWGDGPRAILQMTVTYDDGTEKLFVTDKTWKASTGAIGSNQLVAGEAYDARLEKPDWNKVGYDDSQWSNAAVRPAPKGELRNQLAPPMKVQDTIRPIKMTKHADGGWLFEFDRFFSGWALLKTKGKAGAKITIHYESIPAGWRTVGEKDTYILKGDSEGETYEPRFTFHSVRFVRVEGLEGKPTLDTLQGREVYSDVDMHGSFNCSNDLLNQIHGNIQQTLKVAFKGFVLDGLHREPIFYNEPASYFGTLSARKRMPNMWTEVARGIPLAGSDDGDLSDIVPRLPGMKRKSDVSQNAAYPMLVWYLYQCHGDKGLVEHHCDRVKAWVDFIGRELAEDNHIVTKGFLGEHMLPGREVGQWEFISKETPKDFIWTCFYYHNTRTLANMFQVLGNNKQEKHYRKLAQEIRAVINKKWLDPKTGHYATKSQTSEIIALALDIVPEANKQQLIKNIAHTITEADDGKLRVGHIGLPGFMESLVENGLGQVVYDAVNHTEFPGWGYMVDQGATTVWEGWSLVTKVKEWNDNLYHAEESMTMLAGVGRLFYESIAGIQEPPYYGTAKFGLGYRHFHIKPHPLGDLKHAEASIKTVRGIVSSSWKRTKDSFVLEIEIPVNSTAKVSVPSIGLKNAVVTEGGAAVWKDGAYVKGVAGIDAGIQEAEYYTFDVGSGRYKFTVTSRAQTPVERVETEQQLVAITFDDGPHAVNTPKLLELFKKNDAKATFFVVGRGVRKHPELAKRMLAEGHELGNHTTTHADLAKLGDLEKVRKEIEDTQRILKETIGKPALLFRAPFLSHDENVWTVLKDMPSINASRLTTDWRGDSTPQSIFDQATKDTKAGDIILMHSWQNKTIEAMPRIIKALQAKGLKLVTVSELLAAAKKPVAPATTKSKGKRVFFTGHSFFIAGGYMAKKVDLIAKAAGKEKHELVGWRYSGGRSGAVDKWWAKGADEEPRKSVAAGKVDVLTVCTYWMKKGSEQERCVRNFVKLMQESNPDGLVYLITTKIPSDGKYEGGWDVRTKAELAKLSGWIDETHRYGYHYGGLVDELNKAYGKTVIKAVPLYYGQALMRAQIIDGKVPGVKKQSELYSDAMGHVSELGQRLNAYTVFAAIYGESPVGLHVRQWEKSGDTVLRDQNLSLQKVAWAAVQAVPVPWAAAADKFEGALKPFLGEPKFEIQQVFEGGRFPTLAVATDGTVLAVFGKDGVSLKRSEDGGKTWGEAIVIAKSGFMGGGVTVDEYTGDILAFIEQHHPPATLTVYRSKDHGKTWAAQSDTVIKPNSLGHVPSMHMNDHGITLRHGDKEGRLVRPSRWYGKRNDRNEWPTHYTNSIFSDDGGHSWQASEPFPEMGTGEACIVELSDGTLYYNSRVHWDKRPNFTRRREARSADFGATWTDFRIIEALPDGQQNRSYGCMGGLTRLPVAGKDILIFSNLDTPNPSREQGTVWASFDGGVTWPVKRLANPGSSGYSSMNVGRPGTPSEGWIYFMPETRGARVARFNLSWIVQGGEATGDGKVPEWAAAADKSDGYYGKTKVAPKAEVKARPFDLNQVRLTDGYSNHAQDVNRRYLLSLDGDRLLHNFRVTAGLGSNAKPLAGWESPTCGLRGHFVGHYLSACSQMFASTGDVKLKNRAEQIVAELAKCQTALGTGYLSAFPVKAFDILEERCDSGVWAPYYTIHKIMAGLLDTHILCGDKQALVMLEKMAGYFKKRMDALAAETIEKMLRCDKCNPANEYGGMSDVLHDLYEVTGKPQHLELAHLFDRDCFLGPLMKGKDNLANLHCNTHIPIVLGAARHYELTGMKDYRRAVEFFWERVALMRSYATGNCSGPAANPNRGTSGKSEHWGLADKLAQTLTGGEGESCAGHNMLKVTGKLFSWTADPKYADFAERLYFNTVLNQQNPTSGMFTYHQPLGSPQKKRFGRSNETFTCCYGTGVEAFSELAKDIYFHDSSAIWVNLYIASELNWKDKGLRLEQTAKFPESETAHFVFHLDKPTEMTVNLRIPYWVRTEGSVKINGEQQKHNVMKAGSFYSLKHKWNNGDRLELSLTMGLHLHPMPDDKNLSALMFGPLVLAAQTNGKLTFNGTPTQLLASVKPVKDKPLTFILKSEGESITFKPLYSIRDESYGVYVRTARF